MPVVLALTSFASGLQFCIERGLCPTLPNHDALVKVLINFAKLAVGAVIGEPVSAGDFPVKRENTGNFC
jgi:hypothetical protein